MSPLRARGEALLFALAMAIARSTPRAALLACGAGAGALAGRLDRRHRRIAEDNLRMALGAQADPRIAEECWRHFGRVTADALGFERFGAGRWLERFVRVEGFEHLAAAHAQGRGVLLFSGHLGHWELGALVSGALGVRLSLVARPLDNPRLERLLARARSVSGNTVIYKRRALGEMARALRAGSAVVLLIDQDARERGVFVPFFGRPTSTSRALGVLALRSTAPIVPTFCILRPGGICEVTVEPALDVALAGEPAEDVRRITAAATARLEAWVRRFPEQWLWMHRRWKTEPAGDRPALP